MVLSGQTSEFSNYVSSSAFKVIGYDNVSGFIKSNGTVDTSTYLRTSGGPNSKLTGDLITNKAVTFRNLTSPSTNLIIGYNEGWKDSINMGKKNNQSFVGVAHQKLIELLNYKCKLVGIKLTTVNESYTSKCDGLALEPVKKQEVYSGRRKKRGLFNSSVGKLINADVNGSINIMRKVIGDSYVKNKIIDSGLLFNPVKIKNLFEINSKSLLINLNKNE